MTTKKRNQRWRCSIPCMGALLLPRTLAASKPRNPFMHKTVGARYRSSGSSNNDPDGECDGITMIPSFPSRVGGNTGLADMAVREQTLSKISRSQLPLHVSCDETNSTYDIDTPGVWYQLEGQDQFIQAEIETADESKKPKFALFQGSNCAQELECVRGHQEDDGMELRWFGEEGVTYYFKEFRTIRPENDELDLAYPLDMGDPVTGVTAGAWPHGIVNEECHLKAYSRGLFYSLRGDGEDLKLSLRADISEGNLQVSILSGEDMGECIAHGGHMSADDGGQHFVHFPSVEGQMYMIIVSGESIGASGTREFLLVAKKDKGQDNSRLAVQHPDAADCTTVGLV
eukprot:scaffold4590_cov112-Cylindrotheca_fusiformis.AAC.8